MHRKILQTILIILSAISIQAQQTTQQKMHMYSGNWVFSLNGGGTYGFTDYKESAFGLSLRLSGEYFFEASSNSSFSLKLYFSNDRVTVEDDRGTISSKDSASRFIPATINSDIMSVGLGLTFSYSINNKVFPYAGIGMANLWFDPKDGNGNAAAGNAGGLYETSSQSFYVEGGFKFVVARNLSLNISANMQIALSDYLEDVAAGKSNDAYLTGLIGISYAPFMKTFVTTKKEPTGIKDTKITTDTVSVKVDTTKKVTQPKIEETPKVIVPITAPERITLSADEIFNPNSAQIKFDAKNTIDSVITLVRLSPEASWRIEGHMDSQGTEKMIRTLSFERARAILEYFAAFGGLDKSKFEIFGMGDKFPVGNNNTEEGRKANRRIELIIVR
jgi:outer membrane protein OmpA-like peptidoglycan-associated protein